MGTYNDPEELPTLGTVHQNDIESQGQSEDSHQNGDQREAQESHPVSRRSSTDSTDFKPPDSSTHRSDIPSGIHEATLSYAHGDTDKTDDLPSETSRNLTLDNHQVTKPTIQNPDLDSQNASCSYCHEREALTLCIECKRFLAVFQTWIFNYEKSTKQLDGLMNASLGTYRPSPGQPYPPTFISHINNMLEPLVWPVTDDLGPLTDVFNLRLVASFLFKMVKFVQNYRTRSETIDTYFTVVRSSINKLGGPCAAKSWEQLVATSLYILEDTVADLVKWILQVRRRVVDAIKKNYTWQDNMNMKNATEAEVIMLLADSDYDTPADPSNGFRANFEDWNEHTKSRFWAHVEQLTLGSKMIRAYPSGKHHYLRQAFAFPCQATRPSMNFLPPELPECYEWPNMTELLKELQEGAREDLEEETTPETTRVALKDIIEYS